MLFYICTSTKPLSGELSTAVHNHTAGSSGHHDPGANFVILLLLALSLLVSVPQITAWQDGGTRRGAARRENQCAGRSAEFRVQGFGFGDLGLRFRP